jgi:hypothetical protein
LKLVARIATTTTTTTATTTGLSVFHADTPSQWCPASVSGQDFPVVCLIDVDESCYRREGEAIEVPEVLQDTV